MSTFKLSKTKVKNLVRGALGLTLAVCFAASGFFNPASKVMATETDTTTTDPTTVDVSTNDAVPSSTSDFLFLADNWQTPSVSYGQQVQIVLPVINYGKLPLKNLVVTPRTSASVKDWPFKLDTTGYTRTILHMPGYKSDRNIVDYRQEVNWVFTVRDDVLTGYYPLTFDVVYERDGNIEKAILTVYVQTTGAPGSGSVDAAASNTSKPRIIVTGFETNPAKVYAGATFTLTVHVQNTSKTNEVQNVLFNMEAVQEGTDKNDTYSAFLPTSGSNSAYMDIIGCGETKDIVIEMTAKAGLAQKPYVLDLNMKYDALSAADLADKASVSIPVYQESKCETGAEEVVPADISVGGQANVMFGIYNTGKTTLYNVWVRFKSDSITGGDTFVGNLAAGATGNVDTMVTGAAPNMEDGTITAEISYEDETGAITTIEKQINLNISEEMMDDMSGMDDMGAMGDEMMGEPVKTGISPIWIALIAVVVVVIVVIVVIKLRKKKKAAKELEEDLNALDDEDKL